MQYKINSEQSGHRIDKFLAKNLLDLSRSRIQKLIKENCITVNKKSANSNYKLKENDIIQISNLSRNNIKQTPDKKLRVTSYELRVKAETSEYLVINKPAGLTMHGAEHIKELTLADLILKKYPDIKKVGEDPERPGIVHRLDKEVSGLVVIAKTQDSFDNLKKQFKERSVEKEYIALVYGKIKKDEDEIKFPIDRASTGHKMAALPQTINGKSNIKGRLAITEFEVIKRYINYTLLKINIKTGRTHQIRVHMTAYGYPIVGDNLYSTKKTREQNTRLRLSAQAGRQEKLSIERIFLFANKLSFTDLKGKKQIFKINIPQELKILLEKIK